MNPDSNPNPNHPRALRDLVRVLRDTLSLSLSLCLTPTPTPTPTLTLPLTPNPNPNPNQVRLLRDEGEHLSLAR